MLFYTNYQYFMVFWDKKLNKKVKEKPKYLNNIYLK